jgi:siroheme synthase-like protein
VAEPYPVNLVVEGRPCLVVGGGAVARRKVEGLLACGALVTVVAPDVAPELAALPVTVERRPYRDGDAAGFRLVVAATDDRAVNAAISRDAEAAGVWVNAVDDPEWCSFTLPSVARQGPILVTVSTGGQSPALAAWLRRRIEADLGGEYQVLLRLLSEARATIKAAGRSTEAVDWPSVLDSNMLDLIRAGDIGKARERLEACLSSS